MSGFNSLNPDEKELALKHPLQAIKVYDCASKATNATIEYYGTNGWQDNSDAFRHCCWFNKEQILPHTYDSMIVNFKFLIKAAPKLFD